MTVEPPSQAAAAPLAALIKYQPVAVVVWYKKVAVSPMFVVASVIYAPPVAAGVSVAVPAATEVMNLNCPTVPAANDVAKQLSELIVSSSIEFNELLIPAKMID